MASQKATGNQLISGEISVNTILDLHVNERKKKNGIPCHAQEGDRTDHVYWYTGSCEYIDFSH
jgi:hypothetical protein